MRCGPQRASATPRRRRRTGTRTGRTRHASRSSRSGSARCAGCARSYPTLGGQQAYHWVSDAFGELHSLSVVDESAHDVLIAFCPRDRKNPWIEGTLTVAKDSTLISAAWTFRTPRPDEEAGGDVVFMPWDGSAEERPHLLPARSTYWRRLGSSTRFYQRATTFLCWVISPDAEEPPLPTQPPDGSRCTVSPRGE